MSPTPQVATTEAAPTDDHDRDEPVDQPPPAARRILIFSAAALALLLVGAAAGMLITQARVAEAGPPAADSVDVGFAHDMQVHHLQALTMASIAHARTTDPAVTVLAVDIEGTQGAQIGMMAGWLGVWQYSDLPDPGTHLAWMPSGHHHNGGTGGVQTMPGMATPAELTTLRSLSGKDLDVYFLQLMLRHHQGGLPMARYAAEHAARGVARNLADKIVYSQTHDATVITDMLTERGAQPLPPPT